MDPVHDIFGQTWLVTEARETPLGFDVLVGRPHPPSRQGATVILTDDLAEAIDAMRDTPADLDGVLPIGRTTIKRLRKAMGYHWRADRLDWYLDRLDDLATMTGVEFAQRHGVSEATASIWRNRLVGPRRRPAGWWRAPDVVATLTAPTSAAQAARALEISDGAVRRLRHLLREASHEPDR